MVKKILSWVVGIILLVAITLITFHVVEKYRKPGSMTVLESQAMDMSAMTAPKGRIPVATEIVRRKNIEEKVTYTGSAVPFNEQDVSPRISGWVTELLVYPGDRVEVGQVIARLSASDLSSQLNKARFSTRVAESEIGVATQDLREAIAQSESAGKMVRAVESEVDSSRAQLKYWKAELDRQEYLFKEGAISRDEYQQTEAQYSSVKASLDGAKARLESTKSEETAARYRAQSIDAKIALSENMALEAKADEETARILQEYTVLKSFVRGVVTDRLISLGSLVNPGLVIYKISQVDPIRLQANVSEKDLEGIKVGKTVKVTNSDGTKSVQTRVTSIFPAADPVARTSIVECSTENSDFTFLPGQYVIMEITRERRNDALVVPSKAIVQVDGKPGVWIVESSETSAPLYTCVMHPEVISKEPGKCPKCGMDLVPKETAGGKKAHFAYVSPGISDGDRTEIKEGLKLGDEVIYAGFEYIREGDAVYPTKWGISGPEELPPPPAMEDMPGMKHEPSPGGKPPTEMEDMPGMKHEPSTGGKTPTEMEDMPGMKHKSSPGGKTPTEMEDMPGMKHEPSPNGKPPTEMEDMPGMKHEQKKEVSKPGQKVYTCTMHPQVISDKPGECPICGMDLVEKK